MQLIELAPRWVGVKYENTTIKNGISFLCPHCKEVRIAINFAPYIVETDLQYCLNFERVWSRTGTEFASITFTPSINVESHWHGYITNGEIL